MQSVQVLAILKAQAQTEDYWDTRAATQQITLVYTCMDKERKAGTQRHKEILKEVGVCLADTCQPCAGPFKEPDSFSLNCRTLISTGRSSYQRSLTLLVII